MESIKNVLIIIFISGEIFSFLWCKTEQGYNMEMDIKLKSSNFKDFICGNYKVTFDNTLYRSLILTKDATKSSGNGETVSKLLLD